MINENNIIIYHKIAVNIEQGSIRPLLSTN